MSNKEHSFRVGTQSLLKVNLGACAESNKEFSVLLECIVCLR